MQPLIDFRLGERQQQHIQRLAGHRGQPFIWDGRTALDSQAKLIILTRPPTGPQTETLRRSLDSRSVVVIPFGENPVFDALKARLNDYGMIAPSGSDGPHQLWWGGLNNVGFASGPQIRRPLVVSCYPADVCRNEPINLAQSLHAFGLDHVVQQIDDAPLGRVTGRQKIKFILDTWTNSDRPILWLDPDAVVKRPISLLDTVDCDVALHKWRGWEISTRTLYFGRSAAAEAVLRTWLRLADTFPETWEGYLLDQAWSLVASQIPLSTNWLPRSYHALAADHERHDPPVVIHNLAPGTCELSPCSDFPHALRIARRAGRTGAPEAQLVMSSRQDQRGGTAAVLLRRAGSMDARQVAAIVEDIAKAFDADPAGFAQLELSLCPWQDDLAATLTAARQQNAATIVVDPTHRIPDIMFRTLSEKFANRVEDDGSMHSPVLRQVLPMHCGSLGPQTVPVQTPDRHSALESQS
jgi:hypothetical protein